MDSVFHIRDLHQTYLLTAGSHLIVKKKVCFGLNLVTQEASPSSQIPKQPYLRCFSLPQVFSRKKSLNSLPGGWGWEENVNSTANISEGQKGAGVERVELTVQNVSLQLIPLL